MQRKLKVAPDDTIRAGAGERLEPDYKVLQRLRQSCRISLERYIDIASHCSGQLASLASTSHDDLKRVNLALLVQKEDKAHEVYLKAREVLWKFVLGDRE